MSDPTASLANPSGFDSDQLTRFLRHVLDPSVGVTEMRLLGAKYATETKIIPDSRYGGVISGYYDNPTPLSIDAYKLRGVSAYVCLNPADPSVKARSFNRLKKAKSTTSDKEVVLLRWFLIDIDAVRPSDVSATIAERQAAWDRQAKILTEHPDIAAASLAGSSGNGGYILVRLPDLENDEANRTLLSQMMASLSLRYSDEVAKIDPPNKNASRIGPLPGTLKCKGDHLKGDREWTLVTLTSVGGQPLPENPDDEPILVPINPAEWLLRYPAPPKPDKKPKTSRKPVENVEAVASLDSSRPWTPPVSEGRWPRDVKLRRAIAYIDKVDPAISGEAGHNQTFDVACALVKGFDLELGDARTIIDDWNTKCVPPWDAYDLHHKLVDADEKEDDKPRGYLLEVQGDGGFVEEGGPPPPQSFSFSDLGNAYRMLSKYSRVLRYCSPYKNWLTYDGTRWVQDEHLAIERKAQDIPAMIREEIPVGANSQTIDAYGSWALRSESKDRIAAAISVARSHVSVIPAKLDRDPWLLNVMNGTIDLRNGEIRKHDPFDMITKVAPVVYDPTATCPLWDKVILEIMKDDPSTVDFLRRACGYAITGVIRQHVLIICYGSGGNGKTLTFNTIANVLGDYAVEIDSEILISQTSAQHPTGLTSLEGKRFVVAEESDESKKLAEALVKRLTGGNKISARKMHKDFYEFSPTHHLFFATNHRPDIRNMDIGMWRRLKVLPFERCWHPSSENSRKPDMQLEERLKSESSGILNWLLKGCRDWQEYGLVETRAITEATQGYREEQDFLAWFLEERCVVEKNSKVEIKYLYKDYKDWCEQTSHFPVSIRKFGSQLTDRGFPFKKSNSFVWRVGLRTKTSIETAAEKNEVPIPWDSTDAY